MTCVHLRKLVQLCQQEGVRLAGADLIHIVCPQCGEREVCPSVLMDEYDAREGAAAEKTNARSSVSGMADDAKPGTSFKV